MKQITLKVMPQESMEFFWSIPGFIDAEGNQRDFSYYYVNSKTGDIWSCKSGRYLCPSESTGGYLTVGLMDDNSISYVTGQHRFVLASKVGNWDWDEAGHKDNEQRWNNHPDNLFPTTRPDQFTPECRELQSIAKKNKRSNAAKLSDDVVKCIRDGFKTWSGKRRDFVLAMASVTGVDNDTMYKVIGGRTYKDIV